MPPSERQKMKLLSDKVIIGSTEIDDEWLYYYLGSHYYNHYYCWLINEYKENIEEINKLFSSKVIVKCKGDVKMIPTKEESRIVANHFLNVIADRHDLTAGLITSHNDLSKYSFDDYIEAWISIKKTFAVSYYVCMSVQPDFRHYLPEGYFYSLRLSNDNYETVKVNNIEVCVFDYMNHILIHNPDVRRYRELYNSLLLNFDILRTLLVDDLYRPKLVCVLL